MTSSLETKTESEYLTEVHNAMLQLKRNTAKAKKKKPTFGMLGKHHTEQTKQKISQAMIQNHPMRGKHWSSEIKAKLSEAQRNSIKVQRRWQQYRQQQQRRQQRDSSHHTIHNKG